MYYAVYTYNIYIRFNHEKSFSLYKPFHPIWTHQKTCLKIRLFNSWELNLMYLHTNYLRLYVGNPIKTKCVYRCLEFNVIQLLYILCQFYILMSRQT